jgi:hypothetical protein
MLKSHLRLNVLGGAALSAILGAVLSFFWGLGNAQAQNGVTFLNFEGMGVVTDNPTSSACQTAGNFFGDAYVALYRFTLNPSNNSDALSLVGLRSASRIISTQGPSFSLNGATTADWETLGSRANKFTVSPSSSNLLIAPGAGGSITAATGNIKIVGTLNDFRGDAGCNLNFRAALTKRPD